MASFSYDEIPYEGKAFAQTLPLKLATIAKLFGMNPTDPAHCHMLEIGCGDGANLLPLAQVYPESTFVGFDLASTQVEHGQKTTRDVGLTNVTLETKDVLEFDPKGMKFDYIVAHGIYSWVPDKVRERILEICRDSLTENGIAYISYNCKPGWHIRGMIRDMMRIHTEQFEDPRLQHVQARALLKFLVDSVPTDGPYGQVLKSELEILQKRDDGYLRHELLEDENKSFYFHEFNSQARSHGLQYLGEAEFATMLAGNFPLKVQQTLANVVKDIVGAEQYLDFLRNRMFRMSLLVHDSHKLTRNVPATIAKEMWVGGTAVATNKNVNFMPGHPEQFTLYNKTVFTIDSSLVKMVLVTLEKAFPNVLTFGELMREIRGLVYGGRFAVTDGEQAAFEEQRLCDQLIMLYSRGMVELAAFPYPRAELKVSDKLCATPLARYQAVNDRHHVTNLRHVSLKLDAFVRHVLSQLDGNTPIEKVVESIMDLIRAGKLNMQENGAPVADETRQRQLTQERVDGIVSGLAQLAFFRAA